MRGRPGLAAARLSLPAQRPAPPRALKRLQAPAILQVVGEKAGRHRTSMHVGFPLTRWILLRPAEGRSSEDVREQLDELFTIYWTPLYAFLRRRGLTREDAEDTTQEFLTDLMRRDFLSDLDPAKGKFRHFLLASLKHFLSNERSRQNCRKRGGGRLVHASLDRKSVV